MALRVFKATFYAAIDADERLDADDENSPKLNLENIKEILTTALSAAVEFPSPEDDSFPITTGNGGRTGRMILDTLKEIPKNKWFDEE